MLGKGSCLVFGDSIFLRADDAALDLLHLTFQVVQDNRRRLLVPATGRHFAEVPLAVSILGVVDLCVLLDAQSAVGALLYERRPFPPIPADPLGILLISPCENLRALGQLPRGCLLLDTSHTIVLSVIGQNGQFQAVLTGIP